MSLNTSSKSFPAKSVSGRVLVVRAILMITSEKDSLHLLKRPVCFV
ncbi:MAG: hypothetical protein QXS68_07855 [Candidatus Methanomethylicaceae archaeon]